MCIDVAHLVFETLCDPNDQVVDDRLDGAEGSDILAGAMVQLNVDDIFRWVGEADREMGHVLHELSCGVHEPDPCLSDVHFLPRGPSTLTILDLMCTLTALSQY